MNPRESLFVEALKVSTYRLGASVMNISPTDKMPEPQLAEVVTPDVVTVPVDWWYTNAALPPFACDCCKDWSDYGDFLDEVF